MPKVYLIRHAQSKFNKMNREQSQKYDSVLSKEGIKQAKKLAKRFSNIKIAKIYSSDLKRAYQTANIIAKPKKLEIIKDKELREFDRGDFLIDFREKFEKYYKKEIKKGKSKYEIRPPNGENIWDFIKRLKKFIKKIKKQKGSILVVTHGGVNRVLINLMKGIKKDKFEKIEHHNTGMSIVELKNNKWRVRKINCVRHLN